MNRRLTTAIGAGALVVAMLPGAAANAQDATWTVVADGFDAPRGLAFGPDGLLYVAVAGSGGDECEEGPGPGGEMMQICPGSTGAVATVDVATGERVDLLSGLPSVHEVGIGVIGPPDVAVGAAGDIYVLTADGAVPDAAERMEGDIGGIAWTVGDDGSPQQVADLIAAEAEQNPDGVEAFDANPNGVAVAEDGSLLVADAGANALWMIDSDGSVSVAAAFEPTMVEAPPPPPAAEGEAGAEAEGQAEAEAGAEAGEGGEPVMMPMQQVPTHVTIGPDGAAYVTFLRGFPFQPGSAWVARVAPGEEPTVYADGFTMAIGSAFASDGTLYVLEMFTNSMLSGDPTGGLWAVPPGGGDPMLVTTEGLITPGGIAVSADDVVYVANGSAAPGAGAIVRLDQ